MEMVDGENRFFFLIAFSGFINNMNVTFTEKYAEIKHSNDLCFV